MFFLTSKTVYLGYSNIEFGFGNKKVFFILLLTLVINESRLVYEILDFYIKLEI